MAVTQGTSTGSLGATSFVQNSASSSALQGEVAGSPNTGIRIPFGVLGEYNAAGSTFGIGVAGISTTGYGVAAESTSAQPSLIALAGGTNNALQAVGSTTAGVSAVGVENAGTGDGIDVSATSGDGIFSLASKNGDGIDALAQGTASYADGVYGFAEAGTGIAGYSDTGIGVTASSDSGDALLASATTGTTVFASNTYATDDHAPGDFVSAHAGVFGESNEGIGIVGVNAHNSGMPVLYGDSNFYYDAAQYAGLTGLGNDGVGAFAYSTNDLGALVENNNRYPTLFVNANDSADSANFIIEGAAGNLATDTRIFSVDRTGVVYAKGGFTTASASSRTPGTDVAMYAPQQSVATVDDFGTGHLVNGVAAIPLAADFAATVDTTQRYMVFVTPAGETRGLYVASRNASGFVVRELEGGHSNADFDYRIVARPFGKHLARLPEIRDDASEKSRRLRSAATPQRAAVAPIVPFASTRKQHDAKLAAVLAAQTRTAHAIPQLLNRGNR